MTTSPIPIPGATPTWEPRETAIQWDLPPPPPAPSMRVILNRDITWSQSTATRRIGIRAHCQTDHIEPISADNGDIVLLFQGRLFDQPTESIIDLYKKYGIQYVLKKIHGNFAFILLDQSYKNDESVLYVVTDTFAFKPIYYYQEPGTNIVEFSTTPVQTAVAIPAASYCKMTFSNKVSSMWTFEHESYTPTYDRVSSRWIYPTPKFRFHKYRTLYGGIPGLTVDAISITSFLFKQIRASITRRLAGYSGTVICVGDPASNEFTYMTGIVGRTHPVLRFHWGVDPIASLVDMVRAAGPSGTAPPMVMACSGLLQREMDKSRTLDQGAAAVAAADPEAYECADVELYNFLDTVVQRDLAPQIVEPLAEHGIEVEFPFLEESWLQYYLSIPPNVRYAMYRVWP